MKRLVFKALSKLMVGLVVIAPFLTTSASACSIGLGERKVPGCLKK